MGRRLDALNILLAMWFGVFFPFHNLTDQIMLRAQNISKSPSATNGIFILPV